MNHSAPLKRAFPLWILIVILVTIELTLGSLLMSHTDALKSSNYELTGNNKSLKNQVRQLSAGEQPQFEELPDASGNRVPKRF
ncbi:MAG: hypothetical protein K0S68_784 [Candidatus Saccharibacteria bacterium]|jgi:hypothetical protein|nr:hypothetical protein [Candidatus Saccharibacteria bacterium]